MRIITILCFVSFIPLTLSSCSSLPEAFSTENLMKVHQGMSSDKVLKLFGKPKNFNVSVCGKPPNQWTCTTWKYGGHTEFSDDTASFTFSGKHGSLKLNNFDVDKE